MTSTAPTRRFWTKLGIFNLSVLLYPIIRLINTDGDGDSGIHGVFDRYYRRNPGVCTV